jgi:hypothetical protein
MMTEIETDLHPRSPDLTAFGQALRCGLGAVADLERTLECLDAVLLTGRPHAIADAARAMELSLSIAEPQFRCIGLALEAMGAARLQDAAQQLRRSDQAATAAMVDSFRRALKNFARRNDACRRRAQGLGRGLGASLRTLQALGMGGNGRLIAEA